MSGAAGAPREGRGHWPGGGDGGDSQREGPGGAGDRRRLRAGPGHGGAAAAARGSGGAAGPARVRRGSARPGARGALRLRRGRCDLSRGRGGRAGPGPEEFWPPGPGRELRRDRHRRQNLQQQKGQSARAGGFPEGHQREPGGDLQRDPPERAAHEPQPARRRRPPRARGQHGQRGRLRGPGGPGRVLGVQGRHRGHDAADRPGPGAARHPRGHHRPRAVLHAAPGRAPREGSEFPGTAGAVPVPAGGPGRVRAPGAGAGREPHDQRGGGEAGRGPAHAALSRGIPRPEFGEGERPRRDPAGMDAVAGHAPGTLQDGSAAGTRTGGTGWVGTVFPERTRPPPSGHDPPRVDTTPTPSGDTPRFGDKPQQCGCDITQEVAKPRDGDPAQVWGAHPEPPPPPNVGTPGSPPRPSPTAIKRVRPRGLRALRCPASRLSPLARAAVNPKRSTRDWAAGGTRGSRR